MCKIDSLEIYRVRLPLVYPFRTAYGSDEAVEPILVKLVSGTFYGWGEAQPFQYPTYCPEHSAGVFHLVRDVFAPLFLGQNITSGEMLQSLLACFKGNPFAKGVLDMAWWDLHARLKGLPLWQVLGGENPVVEVGADFGVMESIDALLEKIGQAVTVGFKRVKLKYAPGWDLEMVEAVRRSFPKMIFHIDCNSAYTLEDIPMFKQLDRFDLAMIEQPLMYDDLIDHANLQQQIKTPICLDESITSPEKARKAIEIGACRWINIKPVRVGGLTPALQIHNLCAQAGIPCWVGGMIESSLGMSHCLAMATLSNMKYPSDIFPSTRFFRTDLATPEIVLSGPSQVRAVDGTGIGVEPDSEQLEQLTLEKVVLSS